MEEQTQAQTKVKDYKDLCFTDDFLFCKILSDDLELAKELLELILGLKIVKVELAQSQKSVKFTPFDHGVRFDVYLEDDQGTVFDLEMQTTSSSELPKRSRYYQGMIDLNTIESGESYKHLRKTYVVFICTERPTGFPRNLPIYTFRNQCQEDQRIFLADESYKVFVNAKGNLSSTSEKLRNFLTYLLNRIPTDDLTRRIDEYVEKAKASERWQGEYMTFAMKLDEQYELGLQEGEEKGREEGREEGEQTGRAKTLYKVIQNGYMTVAQAAAMYGMTEEEVKAELATLETGATDL